MVTQLGKILRIIRVNTGDSMRTMAGKLGVSVSYLSAIENGKRNVRFREFMLLLQGILVDSSSKPLVENRFLIEGLSS